MYSQLISYKIPDTTIHNEISLMTSEQSRHSCYTKSVSGIVFMNSPLGIEMQKVRGHAVVKGRELPDSKRL